MKHNKHILLATGNDRTHQYGSKFLGYFFQDKKNVLVDILCIAPVRPSSQGQISNKKSSAKDMNSFQSVVDSVKSKLVDLEFPSENLKTDVKVNSLSTVKDIVAYGRKGLYDALVLGRRGLTLLENLIQDSVSSKILDEQCDIPIWICRMPEREYHNVLLCTDGSLQSLNTADHVGFMLNNDSRHSITIAHVQEQSGKTDQIISNTLAQITDNGFPENRVFIEVLEGKNVSQIILDYADKNKFAAIAMGRKCSSSPAKGLAKYFVGSVSEKVLNNFTSSSLWICK
ncbi:universal stress protein [Desulfonatronovibrio magnus]|uniref:universal stress protein n=1 Tax=Desulfonatronovibrio magnus TaxID=698827 RepID=UPI000696CD74|nr:universal stress protein [Desulfonatronovibrio magnus]